MRQIAHSWYDTLMGHEDGSLNRDGPAHGQSTSYEMLAGSPGSTLRRDSGTGKDLGGVDVDPELEGQVCGPEEPPPHETLRTVGAIVKAFIGSGILFLPSAFQQGGYAFSVVLMFMMAFLNGFGMMRLLQCREKVRIKEGLKLASSRWLPAMHLCIPPHNDPPFRLSAHLAL